MAIIEGLLCQKCLRYFSKYGHLEKERNIKLSKGGLITHKIYCCLPYTDLVYQAGSLQVFCVGAKS